MSNETENQERRGEQWMRDNPRCPHCGHRHLKDYDCILNDIIQSEPALRELFEGPRPT